MIHQFGYFKVYKQNIDEAKAYITKFINKVTINEVNTRVYTSFQSLDDETKFTHYMIFKDKTAEEYHRNTHWVKEFVKELYPICEEQPRFEKVELIAPSFSDLVIKIGPAIQ